MNTNAFSVRIPLKDVSRTAKSSHERSSRPLRRPRCRPRTGARLFSLPCACVEPGASQSLPLPSATTSLDYTTTTTTNASAATSITTGTFRSTYGDRLPGWLLDRLEFLSLTVPTAIQYSSLPVSLGENSTCVGGDVVLHAETGSGKTLAYLLPALASIKKSRNTIQSLVLVPTPELVVQVAHVARRLVATSPVTIPVLPIIGDDLKRTAQQLRASAPRLIVAQALTIKELVDTRRLRLDLVRCMVVDEFDAILNDPKSTYALTHILGLPSRCPPRQTILASATVPQHAQFLRLCIAQHYTRKELTHVAPSIKTDGRKTPQLLNHMYALCNRGKKLGALRALLDAAVTGGGNNKKAMVFVGKSRDALVLAADLSRNNNNSIVAIDEDLMDIQRRDALGKFVSGESNVLICTDVAARGLDVPDVDYVFHLDLPADADRYLHRAGRSARCGKKGTSVLLVQDGEKFVLTRMANALDVEFVRIRGAQDITLSVIR